MVDYLVPGSTLFYHNRAWKKTSIGHPFKNFRLSNRHTGWNKWGFINKYLFNKVKVEARRAKSQKSISKAVSLLDSYDYSRVHCSFSKKNPALWTYSILHIHLLDTLEYLKSNLWCPWSSQITNATHYSEHLLYSAFEI